MSGASDKGQIMDAWVHISHHHVLVDDACFVIPGCENGDGLELEGMENAREKDDQRVSHSCFSLIL